MDAADQKAERAWFLLHCGLPIREVAKRMGVSVPAAFALLDVHAPVAREREQREMLGWGDYAQEPDRPAAPEPPANPDFEPSDMDAPELTGIGRALYPELEDWVPEFGLVAAKWRPHEKWTPVSQRDLRAWVAGEKPVPAWAARAARAMAALGREGLPPPVRARELKAIKMKPGRKKSP
jgi:hypothetical protein